MTIHALVAGAIGTCACAYSCPWHDRCGLCCQPSATEAVSWQSSCFLPPVEILSVAQALIRKYMPIGVIALIFLFVLWARWYFYGRR